MASKPFLDTSKLDSTSFYETFRKYDKDGNNYIEAKEIDAFMKDLFKMKYGSNYSKDQVTKLKDFIMQKYDKNHDKKLDITELAAILPVEENFLLTMKHPVGKARRGSKEVMSSVDFMKIWTNYDPHREGYLGRKQLRGFIADYLEFYEEPKKPADEAEKQVDYLLKNFDKDHDGEITMTELQGFLKVENNFLKSYEIGKHGFSNKDFDKLWNHYDPVSINVFPFICRFLASILPVEFFFLMKFAEKLSSKQDLTSVEFMKGFVADYIQYYDHTKKPSEAANEQVHWLDNNVFFGGSELDALVRDFFTLKFEEKKKSCSPPDMKDISDWRDVMLKFFFFDADEELNKKEIFFFLCKGLTRATNFFLK
ncbi:calretinin [Exaiptasia diaphana]|uniref:EF-hand domain-containing protein n=1 Tax=Exaiptasia diaphana TaxID=2652724 RepID=A0A913YMN2_EXADI|nr:calretinin [Exaiptasia diaphana]